VTLSYELEFWSKFQS